jgi:hypothetical protein
MRRSLSRCRSTSTKVGVDRKWGCDGRTAIACQHARRAISAVDVSLNGSKRGDTGGWRTAAETAAATVGGPETDAKAAPAAGAGDSTILHASWPMASALLSVNKIPVPRAEQGSVTRVRLASCSYRRQANGEGGVWRRQPADGQEGQAQAATQAEGGGQKGRRQLEVHSLWRQAQQAQMTAALGRLSLRRIQSASGNSIVRAMVVPPGQNNQSRVKFTAPLHVALQVSALCYTHVVCNTQ